MAKIKDALVEMVIVFLVGGLIGAVLAVVSNLFVSGVQYFSDQREASEFFLVAIGDYSVSLSPLAFLWTAALVVVFIRTTLGVVKWAGPADAMYAAHQINEPLDIKRGFASTLAAFTSASGGASVGQYGPLVHFGATMGVWVKRFLTSRLSHDVYLGCGVAAAISAGFNAPIAGVVFAHEAVLRHFSLRAIAPIAVASVTASALGTSWFPSVSGFDVSFSVPELAELVPVLVVLAPILAIVAMVFMHSLRFGASLPPKLKISPIAAPFIAATVCGLVGIWVPQILGLGIDSMNDMIAGQFTIGLLITVLVAKILMTSLCIGFGLFGGVFSPALFVGVSAGALAGQLAVIFGVGDVSNVLAIASMAAVSSAVIGAPVSAVLIILELTKSYDCAVAAMLAVMICSLLTHRLFGHSFFDRQLLDRDIDLQKGREAIALSQQKMEDLASDDYVALDPGSDGVHAVEKLKKRGHTEGYIVDENGKMIGKISIYDALKAGEAKVKTVLEVNPIILLSGESLTVAMEKVSQFVGESLPVVNEENDLLGTVTEGDLFQAVIDVQRNARSMER